MLTVTKTTVWHVGTMNPALRNIGGYEGQGLSVSECPDDWRRICKLGDQPHYELSNKKALFADFFSMDMEELFGWAVAQGLAKRIDIFRVKNICDETDKECFFDFESYKLALGELECNGDEDLAGELISKTTAIKATERMNDLFGHEISLDSTSVYAFNLFVAEKTPECDGIWYEHANDGHYSAPSGIIFDHKLSSWTRKQVY